MMTAYQIWGQILLHKGRMMEDHLHYPHQAQKIVKEVQFRPAKPKELDQNSAGFHTGYPGLLAPKKEKTDFVHLIS